MRKRMCMDCGFVGVTSEFWYYGDFLQSHLSPLVGDEVDDTNVPEAIE